MTFPTLRKQSISQYKCCPKHFQQQFPQANVHQLYSEIQPILTPSTQPTRAACRLCDLSAGIHVAASVCCCSKPPRAVCRLQKLHAQIRVAASICCSKPTCAVCRRCIFSHQSEKQSSLSNGTFLCFSVRRRMTHDKSLHYSTSAYVHNVLLRLNSYLALLRCMPWIFPWWSTFTFLSPNPILSERFLQHQRLGKDKVDWCEAIIF